ncbi:MAG: hypothetical protein K0S47_3292 [Herbinix sp.]|jgi:hypothetical protein|nr:hypothetical protein [Herbinix sp.]
MADTSWMNNPKLKNVDPRKLAILLDVMKEAEGKPTDKLVQLFMSTNKRLKEQNLTFDQNETDLMLEILTKNMTPKEKTQFEMIKKMMPKR